MKINWPSLITLGVFSFIYGYNMHSFNIDPLWGLVSALVVSWAWGQLWPIVEKR